MRRIVKINVSNSIKSLKLIFLEDRFEKLDVFFTQIVFLGGIYMCSSVYFIDKQSNEEYIKYFLPFVILFLLYCIYRKAIEKKLTEINTIFDTKTNREILLNFFKDKDYEVSRDSKECLILNQGGYLLSQTISTVILISDNKIYFTILKQGFRMDPPVLYSHITLKKELENYFASITKK